MELKKWAGKPFMPSNGTEGMMFESRWCDLCKLDDLDAEKYCAIHTMALGGNQPKEWKHDENGVPVCTAFKEKIEEIEPEKTTTEIFKDMMNIPFPDENFPRT